jgi:hypothetical protein
MIDRYTITLVRDANGNASVTTRPLRAFRLMPVTASSDHRASAEVRRLSDQVGDEHPQLAWYEVLCLQGGNVSKQVEVPAIALIDRRFPILICLYDTSAFLSIDTELAAPSVRGAFRQLHAYIALLDRHGYSTLVDHASGAVTRVADGLPGLTERVRGEGRQRWLRLVQFDSRVWFVSGWVGISLMAAIAETLEGRRHPIWLLALFGLPCGALLAAFQYLRDRSLLHDRLRAIRDVVIAPSDPPDALRFAVPTIWLELVLTIVIFGGCAGGGWIGGQRAVAIFIATAGLAGATYLLLSDRASVVLDSRGIEGLGTRGRLHIPFEDVDRIIDQTGAPEICTVSSAVRGAVWIPKRVSGRHQLLEILAERVEAACRPAEGAEILDDGQLTAIVDRELGQSRRRRFSFAGVFADRARRSIVLSLMRRHPLRGQHSWRRHLLDRGHVALAHIVHARHALSIPRLDRPDSPHAVLVALSMDRKWQGGGGLSRALEAILRSEEEGERLEDEIARFRTALSRNAGFPLLVRVPPALSGGHTVYCTSLMMSRRDVPLGHLRSSWFPVLVDPRACPFAIVVPFRHWGAAVRRQWKRSPRGGSLILRDAEPMR